MRVRQKFNRTPQCVGDKFEEHLDSSEWQLLLDDADPDGETIRFRYPRDAGQEVEKTLRYERPVIRIELGAPRNISQPNSMKYNPMPRKSFETFLRILEFT